MSRPKLVGNEGAPKADQRLKAVIESVTRQQGAFGDFSVHTTGLPWHDDAGEGFVGTNVGGTSALSVSGPGLSWGFGVKIAKAWFWPDEPGDSDQDMRTSEVEIDDREQLIFLRDALSRLIDAGTLKEEPKPERKKPRKRKRS